MAWASLGLSETGHTPFHDAAETALTGALAAAGFAVLDRKVERGDSGEEYFVTGRIADTPLIWALGSHGANLWVGSPEDPSLDVRFEVYDYATPETFFADLSRVVVEQAERLRSGAA